MLLSLDGLSLDDADILQSSLSSLKYLSQKRPMQSLDAGILTCAQPIWAEILTGAPWYKNGCSGYAKPAGSLNKLSVVSEKDLLVPLALLKADRSEPRTADRSEPRTVTINVPLLRPNVEGRTWLSDGSLPINKTVSPSELLSKPQFQAYSPRAYADVGRSIESPNQAAEKFLDHELKRLDLALELFKDTDWQRFVYRITVFDHLSHLLGLNFFKAHDLQSGGAIQNFLQRLDEAIWTFANFAEGQLLIISGYAHVACRGTINLNVLLEQAGFLSLQSNLKTDRNDTIRLDAMNAIAGAPIASQLASMEGRLIAAETLAASPISGCVFINNAAFEDGSVHERDHENTSVAVKRFLQDALSKRFGTGFAIDEQPKHQEFTFTQIPDFMIKIDGVEFKNMQESAAGRFDIPRTTHSSSGFVLLPGNSVSRKSVKTTQVCELFC